MIEICFLLWAVCGFLGYLLVWWRFDIKDHWEVADIVMVFPSILLGPLGLALNLFLLSGNPKPKDLQ